jgi:hypothetical protein
MKHALSQCPRANKVVVIGGIRTFTLFIPLANQITILMLKTKSIVDEHQIPTKLPKWDLLYTPSVTNQWRCHDDGSIVHIEIVKAAHHHELFLLVCPPHVQTNTHITCPDPSLEHAPKTKPEPTNHKFAQFQQPLLGMNVTNKELLEYAITEIETVELQQAICLNNIEKQPIGSDDDYNSFLESDYDDDDFSDESNDYDLVFKCDDDNDFDE